MYFNLSSWQKMTPTLYDSGGAIIFIKHKFLTSSAAALLGAFTFIFVAVQVAPDIREPSLDLLFPGVLAVPGLYLIVKSLQGMRVRKEMGGVHPTDEVYTLDRNGNYLRRRIGDSEEQLATFDQVRLALHIDRSGKNTSYKIRMSWGDQKVDIANKNTKNDAETLLADLRKRLGLPPMETSA